MAETTCDILVVGLGPAGVAAAYEAAKRKMSVVAVDDNPAPGGQIARAKLGKIDPMIESGYRRMSELGVDIRLGRTVYDAPPGKKIALMTGPSGVETVRWTSLILATGARELCLPFPGWTLPGVMAAGGLQALAKSGLSMQGKRVVVSGSGPLLLPVAKYLKKLGATVFGPFEQAALENLVDFGPKALMAGKFKDMFSYASEMLSLRPNRWIVEAKGKDKVESVTLNNGREIACDYVACSYGFVPNTDLARLLGCKVAHGFVEVDRYQRASALGVFCAGEPTGIAGHESAITEGLIAGRTASGDTAGLDRIIMTAEAQQAFGKAIRKFFAPREEVLKLATDETMICRCEDVTCGRLKNQPTGRDAKLQTRCGMGPCQGRICGPIIRQLFDLDIDSPRPPLAPVPVSALLEEVSAGSSPSSS